MRILVTLLLIFSSLQTINSQARLGNSLEEIQKEFFDYGIRLAIGYLSMENGKEDLLTDNTAGGSTSLVMDLSRYNHAQITYHIGRGGESRSGKINVAFDGASGYSIDDDSTETSDVGVVFDMNISSGLATLVYDTTSTGDDAVFRYSVKRLNDVV